MSYSAAQTFLKQNGYICEEEEDVSDTSSDSEPIQLTKQDAITFITTGDITQLIKQKCKETSEILKINDDEALILLNYYQWRIEPLKNDWIQDRVKISKEAGIEPREVIPVENSENMCLICRRKSREESDSMACNHLICKECWTDCIQDNMTWSDELFFWKCPVKGCNMVIPDSLNQEYINGEKKVQYENRKVVAYTQNIKAFKWCPIPTCQYGVDITDKNIQAIECPCGYVYCKECGQEDHRPLTCQLTTDWLEKHYPKFSIQKLPDYVNNFHCCNAELEIIEDLSKSLKSGEYYGSDGIIDVIQGACKTLRDTKRLEKWSYAYISFINFEQNGELLRWKLEIQQESLDKYTKELQKLLKGVHGLVSEQYKGGIQLTETKCKKILARFLDLADKIIYPPGHVKEPKPQNPQKGKKLHFWVIPVCFILISLFFATLDTDF